jgi:aspartyl aminopeptidase
MLPFFNQNDSGEVRFTQYLAKQLKCKKEDIVSFELAPYEYAQGCFVGENDEFISVHSLDDASLAYCLIRGICESKDGCDIACVFDHEEIGSNSERGAKSNTLAMVIDRICENLGYGFDEKYRALAKTFAFSADMAHATHPSYAYKSDPNLIVKLNKGPVLKLASRQSYATSSKGSAYFINLCENNEIPYQIFNNRSDVGGGGTIGPIISSALGVVCIDIGNPQLSMHSVRELGGVDDVYNMVKLFSVFFDDCKGI